MARVMRPALRVEILDRHHHQRDARHDRNSLAQPRDHRHLVAARGLRFQRHEDAALIDDAAEADSRRQIFDGGIVLDDLHQLELSLGHGRHRCVRRRFRRADDETGVFHREEALRADGVEIARNEQGGESHEQSQEARLQDMIERPAIEILHAVDQKIAGAAEPVLIRAMLDRPQDARAQHRRQR
jgi:hypothetical protein